MISTKQRITTLIRKTLRTVKYLESLKSQIDPHLQISLKKVENLVPVTKIVDADQVIAEVLLQVRSKSLYKLKHDLQLLRMKALQKLKKHKSFPL